MDTISEFFWNAPHAFETSRAVDPLGFDALREAMSNVLVPFLTGATRHAEHYVVVVVGLRWAKSRAQRPIDRDIWPLFARFERGLKQYWHRHPARRPARNHYLGKIKIKEICSGQRPDIESPILQDQRGIGLLGNYIESLRAIGLVRPAQILVDESAATKFLGDPRFEWNGANPGSWATLDRKFAAVDMPVTWARLGHLLFDYNGPEEDRLRMHSAARTLSAQLRATSWRQVASSKSLLRPQQRVAAAVALTTRLEKRLRELFSVLLEGNEPPVDVSGAKQMAALAGTLMRLRVIETVWPGEPPLARVLQRQFHRLTRCQCSPQDLLSWHTEIARTRGIDPWIREVGERSPIELSGQRYEPDFRYTNLRTLLNETKWQP